MKKIKQLPLHEAQKIAAGEVVERPANVVKELIENSIDAGAQKINIYVNDGGQSLIRAVDDGCGMSAEDAQICFDHHATSKISSVEDLPTVQSFGFRGEALASISAVSHVTLMTKELSAKTGIKIERSQSETKNIEEVSCASGTDIIIKDLFFNVPARKKFLKNEQTEWRHIQQLFHAFCFDYQTIHFSLFSENKQVYNCPPVTSFAERAAQVWDDAAARNLITIEYTQKNVTLTGIISNHQFYRYDRNNIYFFVNRRWVKNQQLGKALMKGYLNVIPQGRFPASVISISIDPHEVDINIHPRKQEVQFLHPRIVEQALQNCVKKSLEQNLSAQLKKPVQFHTMPEKKLSFSSEPSTTQFSTARFDTNPQQINIAKPHFEEPLAPHNFVTNLKQSPFVEQKELAVQQKVHQESDENFTIIGHYKKTYILLEKEDGLFIVDQHAAHERVLYEQFKSRFGNLPTVQLLFPQIITLQEESFERIQKHFLMLEQHGIGIEIFGKNQVVIQSTPVHLKDCSMQEFLQEFSALLEQHEDLPPEEWRKALHERLHAQMACKAAIKAGDEMTYEKMRSLLHDLYKTENRFTCPHGRPTGWLLNHDELERKFKRKK
jgi:DNA mismatch repair protein MutL